MAMQEHYKQMQNSEYHTDGACVCRHISPFKEGDLCSHRWQGWRESCISRTPLYNSYDPASISEKDLPSRQLRTWIDKKGKQKSYKYQVKSPLKDPTCWYMGKGSNFRKSAKRPYLHNYHHIITNGELNKHFKVKNGRALIYLMAAKYNINHGKNVIPLPKQQKIGKIIKLPIHCPGKARSHPKYSEYVSAQLKEIAKIINQQLNDKGCEENKVVVDKLKTALINLSKKLEKKIIALGAMYKGPNIENIAKVDK
ncbi:MAG: hypothetical protein GXP08_04870 [Gammaproteobacteria bacterium]|nr:hypothetical protein [Gammaproteobacteria bacterium]